MSSSGNEVLLYVYDLSQGMASALSSMIIGKHIEGIWHTSIIVYGREYFFGSRGVESCDVGRTVLGQPLEIVNLGRTEIPYPVFIDYLNGLSETKFSGLQYSLLKHNCNNFSEELAQFLCGNNIPKHILDLPNEVLETQLGTALHSLISQLERSARPLSEEVNATRAAREPSPEYVQLNSEIEEQRQNSRVLEEKRSTLKEKILRKEQKKEKKLKKQANTIPVEDSEDSFYTMEDVERINGAEGQLPSEQAMQIEEEERRQDEERKKLREPPIVYKDAVDIQVEFDALVGLIDGKLSTDEQRSLEELHQYMFGDEGSWVLDEGFLNFVGRLLNDKALPTEVKVHTLNVLAVAALKDDVILLLHQDRRDHVIMNYAFDIDRHSEEEQQALALFTVNMFENLSSSEWLMYISEWPYNNQQTSNIRVTTKVAVHSLLSDLPILQDRGSAIIYNMACKEVKTVVFDDVAVELTMAILQYFNSNPSEEQIFRCLKSLGKFIQVSGQEVPQLIQMIGPDPNIFKGTSARVDEQIQAMSTKLR